MTAQMSPIKISTPKRPLYPVLNMARSFRVTTAP
jgi:hypothetical protein